MTRAAAPPAPQQDPDTPPSFTWRKVSAGDGLSLACRDYGPPDDPRPPLLCLPGLTRNSADFDRLARRQAALGRRVLCPDLRGRGRSGYATDWRSYRAPTLATDIRHLMVALEVERAVIVGTSMGGLLGLGLRVAAPGAVAGLVLNDIGPEVPRDGLDGIRAMLTKLTPQEDWDAVAALLRGLMPPLSLATDDDWLDFARATYRAAKDGRLVPDWDPAILAPLERDPPVGDLWPLFAGAAGCPLLVVRGEVSGVLKPETLARMKARQPGMRTVTVPGVGHAPTLDEPEVRAALDAFLDASAPLSGMSAG